MPRSSLGQIEHLKYFGIDDDLEIFLLGPSQLDVDIRDLLLALIIFLGLKFGLLGRVAMESSLLFAIIVADEFAAASESGMAKSIVSDSVSSI